MSDNVPERGPHEVNRLSYNPMHNYRRVDLDAWAEQWFAGFVDLEPGSEAYEVAERAMLGSLYAYPAEREVDARDLKIGMELLQLFGSHNPYSSNAKSTDERLQYELWERDWQYARLTGRHLTRILLDD